MLIDKNNKDQILMQYQKELDLPIYISLDNSEFNPSIVSFFNKLNFSEVKLEGHLKKIEKNKNARLLKIELASNRVAQQIEYMVDSDRFGHESVIPKDGYQVYRYKGTGMIIYSLGASIWTLGCLDDFGVNPDIETSHKIIINRFLSWSLSQLGIIGFWGVPIEEGLVVMRANQCNGEAVFIDIRNKKILSIEGVVPLKNTFKVIRLNKNLSDRNIRMNKEELVGFLSTYCTYFDFSGPSIAVRQMIKSLSNMAAGIVHPQEKFLPRLEA